MALPELMLRLAIAFITLLLLTRLMGRKEISQMTFFNFVSAIAIGTLGASLAIDSTLSVRNGIIALTAWSVFTIFLGYLDIKSKKIRYFVEGQPIILIRKGRIMEEELRKTRLDVDALIVLLRKKNVFSVADVDYAIFETDGSLSVMKKNDKELVTKKDMNIQASSPAPFSMPSVVIADGIVNKENLKELSLDRQWLEQQLQSAGGYSIKEVFLAEVQKDGTLYIDTTQDMVH
ncbi:YetF domain-containing protein [Halobacillus massiliensis]|uniref:YetF domain-containing protein n=1 Tax=Halobacillus massiliensis TaxID=1926286 RepID=UPI0009E4C0F8|nr:DUF421 domain-containing protein [Halobacillus massiliensis]